jgi:RimJ/RimL family protein N-acetyltransferase
MYREIGNFIIRDWKIEDAPSIAKYANNRKIWMNLRDAFPHPYSLHDAEAFISRVVKSDQAHLFAIATQSEAIGGIGFVPGKDVHRYTAELGYWLAEPFWGKGIMTQAVRSLAAYAMHDLRLHRLYAEPYSTNPASMRVLEKAGFICEGRLRSNAFKDGKVLDQFIYSVIGKESNDV